MTSLAAALFPDFEKSNDQLVADPSHSSLTQRSQHYLYYQENTWDVVNLARTLTIIGASPTLAIVCHGFVRRVYGL